MRIYPVSYQICEAGSETPHFCASIAFAYKNEPKNEVLLSLQMNIKADLKKQGFEVKVIPFENGVIDKIEAYQENEKAFELKEFWIKEA